LLLENGDDENDEAEEDELSENGDDEEDDPSWFSRRNRPVLLRCRVAWFRAWWCLAGGETSSTSRLRSCCDGASSEGEEEVDAEEAKGMEDGEDKNAGRIEMHVWICRTRYMPEVAMAFVEVDVEGKPLSTESSTGW
jgi:hypothetical protein